MNKNMKIEDLIKELQKIQKEQGNINVAVKFKFRDDGGIYEVTDSLLLYVEENKTNKEKTLIL